MNVKKPKENETRMDGNTSADRSGSDKEVKT